MFLFLYRARLESTSDSVEMVRTDDVLMIEGRSSMVTRLYFF